MNQKQIIMQLESEWDSTSTQGFFSQMRKGQLDLVGFERVKNLLDALPSSDEESETINRRIVELVWFIPTFLRWQRDGWIQEGMETDELDKIIDYFEGRITTILGLP